jgi:hypothetical protein
VRAAALGLPVVELDPWYDVDDAAALHRLCRELASAPASRGPSPYPARATAECIARLRIAELLSAAPAAAAAE